MKASRTIPIRLDNLHFKVLPLFDRWITLNQRKLLASSSATSVKRFLRDLRLCPPISWFTRTLVLSPVPFAGRGSIKSRTWRNTLIPTPGRSPTSVSSVERLSVSHPISLPTRGNIRGSSRFPAEGVRSHFRGRLISRDTLKLVMRYRAIEKSRQLIVWTDF